MKDIENRLKDALARLESTTQKVITTRGYTKDAKSAKALEEMIREQLKNANSRSSTRSIR